MYFWYTDWCTVCTGYSNESCDSQNLNHVTSKTELTEWQTTELSMQIVWTHTHTHTDNCTERHRTAVHFNQSSSNFSSPLSFITGLVCIHLHEKAEEQELAPDTSLIYIMSVSCEEEREKIHCTHLRTLSLTHTSTHIQMNAICFWC